VCLATAHPAKFSEVIEETLGFKPQEPEAISALKDMPMRSNKMDADPYDVKKFIISSLQG
ncbi:MAG: threonine synthase, partial [Deferribacterales bacterium]|nr:threonine synthase [Deferribacterales bacterium]